MRLFAYKMKDNIYFQSILKFFGEMTSNKLRSIFLYRKLFTKLTSTQTYSRLKFNTYRFHINPIVNFCNINDQTYLFDVIIFYQTVQISKLLLRNLSRN